LLRAEDSKLNDPRMTLVLQRLSNEIIRIMHAVLGDDESHRLGPTVAVALDDTLLQLKLWEDELSFRDSEKEGQGLEIIKASHPWVSNTKIEILEIMTQSVRFLLEWLPPEEITF
jgi:hypothetical protein